MIRRILNWLFPKPEPELEEELELEEPPEGYYEYALVRLPAGHLLWIYKSWYDYMCDQNGTLVWFRDGSIHVASPDYFAQIWHDDIYLWSTQVELVVTANFPRVRDDGWPYSSLALQDSDTRILEEVHEIREQQRESSVARDFRRLQNTLRIPQRTQRAPINESPLSWKECGF